MAAQKNSKKQHTSSVKNISVLSIILFLVVVVWITMFGENEITQTFTTDDSLELLTVHFIDIGQGDSILIKNSQNEFMLIDTGEKDQYENLKSYLDKQGVDKFKYVIFTHPHSDHIGSSDKIVKTYDIETLIMPAVTHTTNIFARLIDEIEAKNMNITQAVAGDEYIFGNAEFLIIAPVKDDYSNLNDHSVAIKMTHGGINFLFTGDIEKTSESDIVEFCEVNNIDMSADVLKVAHHGSSTSSTQKILDLIRPRTAVIMCDGKSYSHPHGEVVERIEAMETEIYRTDLNGSIAVISNGEDFTVESEVKKEVEVKSETKAK